MAPLASLATFATLGVTPSRGACDLTGHQGWGSRMLRTRCALQSSQVYAADVNEKQITQTRGWPALCKVVQETEALFLSFGSFCRKCLIARTPG